MDETSVENIPDTEWVQIELGRRKRRDSVLGINYFQQEVILRHRTAYVVGVYLEDVDSGANNEYVGMILMKTGWKRLYFLSERPAWKESNGVYQFDNYFELAKRLMWKKGITVP